MTRRFTMALALFALLFSLAVAPAPAVAAPKEETCPNRLCTFLLPDSYENVSKQETFRTYRDIATNDLFILLVGPVPSGATLLDVVNGAVGEYAKSGEFLPIGKIRDEIVGGAAAKSFAYEARDSGGTMIHHEAFFLLRNGSVINLNFVVVPERVEAVVPAADLVLASFLFP